MLDIKGTAQQFCDGVSRRNFLRIGALGASFTLADLLRAQAAQSAVGKPTRAKAAIMIYLPGGPSHMDMYDLKPNAPVEFRGEFKPIATNVPGVEICEHFPMQAKMWDKFACIRSVIGTNEHSDSAVTTGYSEAINRVANHPSFGSVVSKLRGGSEVPAYVSLRGSSRGTEPGFLGGAHRPFTPSGPGNDDLRLANGVSSDRLSERKDLLSGIDDAKRAVDASGAMSAMDVFNQKAFEMVTSGVVRNALDLNRVDGKTRQRYEKCEQFLTARRLIEAGVGCVTLSIGGWDTHGGNFTSLRKQLPLVDRAVANMVQDLHDAGLGDDVVTIMWGEFGRTPKINTSAGRDHWPAVMSAMIAGGGLRMGQAIGTSTARGETPKDSPYSVQQVLSTIYHAIGIDPAKTFPNGNGRPMYVLDERTQVRELI
jgi:hypothetical protein